MTYNYSPEKKRIRKHFNSRADSYESCAVLQKEICDRMLERLELVTLEPQVVLDCGAGTGWGAQGLMKRYRKSRVIALDLSLSMLQKTAGKGSWLRRPSLVCADAESIPLADESVDLVFSSLMLQWCDAEKTFAEFKRILKPGGLLMFSTFGPDTLKELKASWARVDDDVHVNAFTDMHDLGDALMQQGLAEPVMDMDLVTLTYDEPASVMRDLRAIGANTALHSRNRGLMTPGKFRKVIQAYEGFRQQGVIPATFEVVFGHAWKLQQRATKLSSSEFSIPISDISRPHK